MGAVAVSALLLLVGGLDALLARLRSGQAAETPIAEANPGLLIADDYMWALTREGQGRCCHDSSRIADYDLDQ